MALSGGNAFVDVEVVDATALFAESEDVVLEDAVLEDTVLDAVAGLTAGKTVFATSAFCAAACVVLDDGCGVRLQPDRHKIKTNPNGTIIPKRCLAARKLYRLEHGKVIKKVDIINTAL